MMKFNIAKLLAIDLCYRLEPFCSHINIAGSVRRRKALVKDIEIVCVPLNAENKNLFGEVTETLRSPEFSNAVKSIGTIKKGNPEDGRYVQIFIEEHKVNLDLFITVDHDYARQYAIRTGSAHFSKLIADRWVKLGWCGTEDGLRRQSECIRQGDTWKCMVKKPQTPPHWQSEKEFFDFLGLMQIPTPYRDENNHPTLLNVIKQ